MMIVRVIIKGGIAVGFFAGLARAIWGDWWVALIVVGKARARATMRANAID